MTAYVLSAKGAVFPLAGGSAPGSRKCKTASAESAIHSRAFSVHSWSHAAIVPESRLQRSFTIRSQSQGEAPGCHERAPLALNRYERRSRHSKGVCFPKLTRCCCRR